MTAYLVDNEVIWINSSGSSVSVVSGSKILSNTPGVIFAGIDSNSRVSFPSINDGIIDVNTSQKYAEVDLYFSDITGSTYFVAVDLDNQFYSYKHDSTMSGIKISSIKGYAERTHILDKWKINLGVVLSTTTSSINIFWTNYGLISFLDATSLEKNVNDNVNSTDLTVQSGSLLKQSNNYKENILDLSSMTSLPDVFGNMINLNPGDLIFRVKRLSNHGGYLSFHYHLWYKLKD